MHDLTEMPIVTFFTKGEVVRGAWFDKLTMTFDKLIGQFGKLTPRHSASSSGNLECSP